ncbi:MAG: NUDIX hydrolase [Planctomycetota bacterium]
MFWSSGHPGLSEVCDLSYAMRLIDGYQPSSIAQAEEKHRVLRFCQKNTDALFRTCKPGHLTASAIVVDHTRTKVLLHHHAKLNRWLQFGGHCDGDGNLPHVAWREAVEESGVAGLLIDAMIVDFDIHLIPEHGVEPEHLHLDARFVAEAPAGSIPQMSDESTALCWYSMDELGLIDTDESVIRLARIALLKEG